MLYTVIGVQPDPTVVVTDFESAAMKAVTQVFGSQVETHGCFFHLTQATWRQIQSEGLSNLYKTDEEFRLFCGMMDGLAFLPVQEVKQGKYYRFRKVIGNAIQRTVYVYYCLNNSFVISK